MTIRSQWDVLPFWDWLRGCCGFAGELLISVASLAPILEISEKADFSFSMSESRPSARDLICVWPKIIVISGPLYSNGVPREWCLMPQLTRDGDCTRVIAFHLAVWELRDVS